MDADELAIKQREYKLEVWKLLVSILTPLALLALTFVVNSAIQERGALLKREEQILAEKQKIYAELGRRLNIIYIYIADVGDFRSYTPPRVVELKRESDRQFFMYRPYWSETTEQKYNDYMKAAFTTYTGAGMPAKINAYNAQKVAAYNVDKLQWDAAWDAYFTEKSDPNIEAKYNALVGSLLADIVSAVIRKSEQYSGDGIMSAINFDMIMDREVDAKGDRVKLTMTGKSLPLKCYGAHGNEQAYGYKEGQGARRVENRENPF